MNVKHKPAKDSGGVYTVPAVKKALAIMELMAADNRGYTISEVARRCGLPVSTANVLLHSLQDCGYLNRSADRTFLLTWKLFTEGSKLLNQVKLQEVALPELERLAEITDLTIDLAIPDKIELIYAHVIQGSGDIQIQARVGQRRYFHQSAVGKAMLAFFPEERAVEFAETTGLPAATPKTVTSLRTLQKELKIIRDRGYAVDMEESGRGLWGVASPIFDHTGNVVAAVGVAGTTLARNTNRNQLVMEIKKSASAISQRLGFSRNGVYAQHGVADTDNEFRTARAK